MKTRFVLSTGLSASLLLLSACASPSTPSAQVTPAVSANSAPTSAAPTGNKQVVRLSTWAGIEEAKELQAIIERLNGQSTTYQIVHEPQPADYYVKLQTNLAGGTAADLLWLSQEYIVPYADKGVLLDVTDRLQADTNPAAKLDDYFPSILQTAQYNGRTYGLPWIAQPVVLYYNPKLFADAGVEIPTDAWTWDDFKAAAAKLTRDTNADGAVDVYGTAFNDWPPIQMFIWQAGGDVINEAATKTTINTPEALQGIAFYSDIIYNPLYAVPQNVIQEQGFGELAKNGKVAMFFGGAADDLDTAHAKDPKFADMKVALVPNGPKNRATFAWTASTVINKASAHPDVAYEAMVALTDAIQHWKIVAPRKSLANAQAIVASVPQKQAAAEVIIKALADARSLRIVPKQTQWDTAFWEKFKDPLYRKQGSAKDLAESALPDLDAALAK
jgi:multiple sugar transport system substrate-binding protein